MSVWFGLHNTEMWPYDARSPRLPQRMTSMNWNTFDLNLLVVFDAAMQERNLTRAGRRLGMSQPAMSHAMARLRHALNDELFVRTPEGMCATPRAERMLGPVRAALHELQTTLEDDEFDPSVSSREFVIAVNNHAAHVIIPTLVHRVATLAPSVVLDVRPIGLSEVLDQIDDGVVELALSSLAEGGDRFKCVGLLEDEYTIVLWEDHPDCASPKLSIERLAALPHVGITSAGDDTHFIDDTLAEHGLSRLISTKVPLHSLAGVLIGSNAVAVLPRCVAQHIAAHAPLITRGLPFSAPARKLSMMWHRRFDNHPAHRWLRAILRNTVNDAAHRAPREHGLELLSAMSATIVPCRSDIPDESVPI